ncbi:hypothetical protein COV81_01065 [Candidatus Peregrinibacteria bacterium CG11_big_fil_rev_8_21_14_0_20_41_10]|nr:MAG: hypothetical protein COV81_01065 [Candidatus Peregrinibacteria bacterium CG11_big_fil_rev_8_21_14_0_20_41_10]PIZ75245.1 MAG: hypothetical protein COY06_03120 [Candidatus Peregrinibacteria bacterium CG_4_10_14_0_2_um_filter_41_8]PJC38133.1 MAG: hypothetical protein CO045_02000 [Candidatus Peregrinibacteria bacterium CG_4_9_14_0_2_um_filter_41_14]
MRPKLTFAALIGAALIITGVIVPLVWAQTSTALTVTERAAEYHVAANNLVNAKLMQLATLLNSIKDDPTTRSQLREKLAKLPEEECLTKENNLSVFCLYSGLNQLKSQFFLDLDNSISAKIGLTDTNSDNLNTAVVSEQNRAVIVAQLKSESELLMDQVLQAYTQIVLANVLHQENVVTINEVENLQDNLKDLQSEIALLPFKFSNVSTTQCR